MDQVDLIEDTKFQDRALNYQNAYEALHAQHIELQGKYSAQACLIKEALAAIIAAEAKVQQRHQGLLDAQCDHQMEIKSLMNKAVEQYQVQLSTAQSNLQTQDHEHQLAIQKLQRKIQMLEVSLASQVNLPSMGVTQSHDGTGLCNEVFNFIPGTVNKYQGVVPKVTFTQFHNELVRVLGTHQHSKGSIKAVSVSAVGAISEQK